jgi:MFS family permease
MFTDMTTASERHVRRTLRWVLVISVIGVGGLAGIGAALNYYRHHYGNWQIGVTAAAIGAGITIGTTLTVLLVDHVVRSEEAMARSRRTVIQSVVLLLAVGGALGGAGAGYSYANNTGGWFAAVFVGIGTALGAWLAAAVLGLLVEIANSLRQISLAGQTVGALSTAAYRESEGHDVSVPDPA